MNGIGAIPLNLIHDETLPLRISNDPNEAKPLRAKFRMTRNRNLTAAIESCVEGAFRKDAVCGIQVMQRPNQGFNLKVSLTALDPDRALAYGGK
jgi:hypothetical protein